MWRKFGHQQLYFINGVKATVDEFISNLEYRQRRGYHYQVRTINSISTLYF